jgi:hypothetical protein
MSALCDGTRKQCCLTRRHDEEFALREGAACRILVKAFSVLTFLFRFCVKTKMKACPAGRKVKARLPKLQLSNWHYFK